MKIGISACLLGENVTWRGDNNKEDDLLELLKGHEIIKICPEVMGGLSIPRNPCEIASYEPLLVESNKGEDFTEYFTKGAKKAYEKIKDVDFLVLKANSPSCGNMQVYDGSFSHILVDKLGVFAYLCSKKGITIYNETQLDEIIFHLSKDN